MVNGKVNGKRMVKGGERMAKGGERIVGG